MGNKQIPWCGWLIVWTVWTLVFLCLVAWLATQEGWFGLSPVEMTWGTW